MEVKHIHNYTVVRQVLHGHNCSVVIDAPNFIHKILLLTLSGWVCEDEEHKNCFELQVRQHQGKFRIKSDLVYTPTPRSDPVDTLNEIFLSLCYLLAAKNPDGFLVHCAAFREKDINNVILASKKSGKSTLVLEKSQQGSSILADDLAIWFPRRGQLMSLGLPIRMRRPVPGKFKLRKQDFIAGKNIAYSVASTFDCFAVGQLFVPDSIMTFDGRELKTIPFWRWPYKLNQFGIDGAYSQLKSIDCPVLQK